MEEDIEFPFKKKKKKIEMIKLNSSHTKEYQIKTGL